MSVSYPLPIVLDHYMEISNRVFEINSYCMLNIFQDKRLEKDLIHFVCLENNLIHFVTRDI